MLVRVDSREIRDAESFHDVFARVMGFPSSYGRNFDAWIDCMSDLDSDTGMTTVRAKEGEMVVLQLDHAAEFAVRCPTLFRALVDSAAFVNWRRIEAGERAVLALSYDL